MQRFFTLVALLLFALPIGLSVTGCTTNVAAFCNGAGYGARLTDIYSVRFTSAASAVGISLAYGQSAQVGTATAANCRGTTLSTGAATYGSSDLQHADISPTGQVCAGTWNRQSTGGIPNYTICSPSNTATTATVTASIGGITSNPLSIYVHPPISAITVAQPQSCLSTGVTAPQTFVQQTSVFDQAGALVNGANVGTITYTANTPNIVTINNTNTNSTATASGTTPVTTNSAPNGTAVANQPGGTVITASISGQGGNATATSSAAGYFYTCPPRSLALQLNSSTGVPVNPDGSITVTAGNPQTVNAVLTDVNGVGITPLSGSGPDYSSTLPQQVSVSSTGTVTTTLSGVATVTGICQPGAPTSTTTTSASTSSTASGNSCNPTPLNQLGTFGTGLPITGNPLVVRAPGTNNTQLWAAAPNSLQFTPFDLALGTAGSPVLLPFPPNSMVLDPTGTNLYFGSYRELMIYTASTNTLTTQDTTVPGVVLAVSPSNSQVVIADQIRQVIYLYTPATRTAATTGTQSSTTASSVISTGGLATHAEFSPDGKNVYIVGPTALTIHNVVTGFSQYPIANPNATVSCALDNTQSNPFCSPDLALTVPSVAVFTSGQALTARSFCPDITATPVTYYPVAATVIGDAADHLAATPDGTHILGANTTQIFDVEHGPVSDTTRFVAPIGACPGVGSAPGPLGIQTTLRQLALTGITPTQINQVLSSPDSSRAVITYTAADASGLLPLYLPSSTPGGTGALQNVQLASGAQAPIAGAFSPDATLFFASTTGDNLIHIVNAATATDRQQLNPQLTDTTGRVVPAQFLQTRARPTS